MTNFEKITLVAIGVIFVLVLAFGMIVFRQQKTINALARNAKTSSGQLAQTAAKKDGPPLTDVIKQFSGTVENISGNQLTISTKLVDFSKPKNPDQFKNTDSPMNISGNDFEMMDKKITVNTNEKTVFVAKNLSELKTGDRVSVSSDKSPYTTDTVTAKRVTYSVTPK